MRSSGFIWGLLRADWGILSYQTTCLLRCPRAELNIELDFLLDLGLSVRGLKDPQACLNSILVEELPDCVYFFSDGSVDPVAKRLGCSFIDPSANYRFGVRLQDWAMVGTAKLFCILYDFKYINRKNYSRAAVLTNSRLAINALADRLYNPMLLPLVHAVAHQIVVARSRGLSVSVAWILAYACILGNNGRLYRQIGYVPPVFSALWGLLGGHYELIEGDFDSWVRALRLHVKGGRCLNGYFDRVFFKTPKPWFRGHDAPCNSINLVTRSRSSHVCFRDHFVRVAWNLDPRCRCSAEMKTLSYLFTEFLSS